MPDETDVAQRDSIATIIDGARRRAPDVPPREDTANKFPTMFDIQTIAVLAGPTWVDAHLSAQFKIRSVRVDNGTNQWLQMGPNADYIPPFTYGVVFNVRGQGTVEIYRAVPLNSGITQLTPVVGQSYTVTVFDKPQPPFNYSAAVATGFRLGAQPIITRVAATAFGAGNAIVVTVPASGPAWQIDSIADTFVNTAVVGNRVYKWTVRDAAGNVIDSATDSTVAIAGVTRNAFFHVGGTPNVTTVVGGEDFVGLPSSLVVPAGGTLTLSEVTAIDAADTATIELVATPVL